MYKYIYIVWVDCSSLLIKPTICIYIYIIIYIYVYTLHIWLNPSVFRRPSIGCWMSTCTNVVKPILQHPIAKSTPNFTKLRLGDGDYGGFISYPTHIIYTCIYRWFSQPLQFIDDVSLQNRSVFRWISKDCLHLSLSRWFRNCGAVVLPLCQLPGPSRCHGSELESHKAMGYPFNNRDVISNCMYNIISIS